MWTPRRHRTAAVHRPTMDRHDQKNLVLPSSSIQPQTFNKIIKPKATLKARKRKKISYYLVHGHDAGWIE
jgi:hypothetical protein